jgi:hypothetical protein
MANALTPEKQKRLDELLEENGWSADTLLFRSTPDEHLKATDEPGVFEITANPDPSEAIIDIYDGDHGMLALHLGPGLSFAEAKDHMWRDDARRLVGLRVGDLAAQGGLLYPVESVVTEKVWYATLPDGAVRVRLVDDGSGGA